MAREKNDDSTERGGMRGARMPKEHNEKDLGQPNPCCGLKYATEFGNPEDLDRAGAGLANYAKKHQAKH
jgi:hypothetical protein